MGTERGFPALSRCGRGEEETVDTRGREREKMADAPSHQRGLGTTPTPANPRTETLEQELSLSHHTDLELSLIRPFVARGSSHRSAPFFAPPPFEAFRGSSRKGAFLLPDRVTPCIHQSGASCPTPPPSHQARRLSGERFRREKFGREMSGGRPPPGAPARTFSAQSCVPHPSRGDRGRAVHIGWRS